MCSPRQKSSLIAHKTRSYACRRRIYSVHLRALVFRARRRHRARRRVQHVLAAYVIRAHRVHKATRCVHRWMCNGQGAVCVKVARAGKSFPPGNWLSFTGVDHSASVQPTWFDWMCGVFVEQRLYSDGDETRLRCVTHANVCQMQKGQRLYVHGVYFVLE
jgi:hypothetical protein